jgi:hypothetical protein
MFSLGIINQLSDADFNELVRDRAFADHGCRLKYYSGNFCSPLTVKTAEATETEVPGCPPPI